MKQTLIASSLALGAFLVTPSAVAVKLDITPSGFVDFIWTLSDGTDLGKNGEEGHFDTSGELDVEANLKEGISMRFDADVNPSSAGSDSARLEQIYLKWDINPKMSLMGGVFNNKLTFEREDTPDMYQVTHGQLWDIWNVSTAEDGNNLQGMEFNYQTNQLNLIIGYLNDLNDTPEENSMEFAAEIQATKNLGITLGLITQDQNLENIVDIFVTYKTRKLLFAGEIMAADKQVDSGLMLMANFQINSKFSATVRYDLVDYDNTFLAEDTSSLTIAGLYSISKNLFANAEIRFNDDDNLPAAAPDVGEGDGTTARLELLATF